MSDPTDLDRDFMPLWTGLELVSPLRARVIGLMPRAVYGISIDTRTLQAGDLFFAIRGEKSDGHSYVETAFARGAAAAVVDEEHADTLRPFGPLYVVRDVMAAMESLGQAARARMSGFVIAVTGSVGKTSTKEALRDVLGAFGKVHASVASYNNHIGVPLTLARMPIDTSFGIFEIGMNHANEIRPLSKMVRPHIAVITAIAPVHLENLGTVEAIADAKAEIFDGLENGGIAIIPRDTRHHERLDEWARKSQAGGILTFGEMDQADARLLSCVAEPNGSQVSAKVMGEKLSYRIGAPGKHLAMNSLALLLAARAAGVDVAKAAQELARVSAPQGRGAQMTLDMGEGSAVLIDESYNANPVSMRAALTLLSQAPLPGQGGRRIAMLGDMLELGPEEDFLHAELADAISVLPVDIVHTAGPLMRHLHDVLPQDQRGLHGASCADILDTLVASVRAGDVVMIKGSNGSRMGAVVAALKERYGPNKTSKG